jgi:hypothetical protein
MIEFEASGEFESCDDIIYSLEDVISQLRSGCRGGYNGDMMWDISGEEGVDDD